MTLSAKGCTSVEEWPTTKVYLGALARWTISTIILTLFLALNWRSITLAFRIAALSLFLFHLFFYLQVTSERSITQFQFWIFNTRAKKVFSSETQHLPSGISSCIKINNKSVARCLPTSSSGCIQSRFQHTSTPNERSMQTSALEKYVQGRHLFFKTGKFEVFLYIWKVGVFVFGWAIDWGNIKSSRLQSNGSLMVLLHLAWCACNVASCARNWSHF